MKKYNLIFLSNIKLLLSKRIFNSWKEIQSFYDDYMTSIEFNSLEEVNDYLCIEYNLTIEQASILTAKINAAENDIELMF